MHNTEERFLVTAGLGCVCGLAVLTAAVPVVGYVLLGLVGLGVLGLIAGAASLWWDTRATPDSDGPRAHTQSAPARQEVA